MKSRSKILAAILAALVVAATVWIGYRFLAGGVRQAQKHPTMFCSFQVEDATVRAYSFQLAAASEIDLDTVNAAMAQDGATVPRTGEMQNVSLEASGLLLLRFYGAGKTGWDVAGKISEPTLYVNGRIPAYADQISRPFSFHLGTGGEIGAFHFPAGTEGHSRSLVSRIVLAMQIVLPRTPLTTWQAMGEDSTGLFNAVYTVVAVEGETATVRRQTRDYLKLSEELQAVPFLTGTFVVVEKSGTEATVSPRLWVGSLSAEEKHSFAAGGRQWLRSTGTVRIHEAAGTVPYKFPEQFSDVLAQIDAQKYVEEQFSRTDPVLDRMGAGLDMNGALDAYRNLLGSGDKGAAEKFMVNYLRQHPGAAAELLETLDADPDFELYDEKTHLVLWRLVIEAGTPEAQRAVIRAATDPAFGSGSHVRALMYVGDFENPHTFLLEELWSLHRDPDVAADPEVSPILENMSIFAVGTLGYRDKLNRGTMTAAANGLVANLRLSADDPEETALTLMAMGNTGNDDLLETVEPYFSDDNASVRAAACAAVRRMQTPAAQEALIRTYDADHTEKVRQAALKSLLQMPLTAESAAWTRRETLAGADTSDQVLLVELLASTRSIYPRNEEALRELLQTNPPLPVRQTIYKFLAPR